MNYVYRAPERRRSRWRWMPIIAAVLLAVTIAGGVYAYSARQAEPKTPQAVTKTEPKPIVVPKQTLQGTYLYSGTIVLGRGVESEAKGNYAQPFNAFNTFSPEKYDGWIADLECPVTGNSTSFAQQVQTLRFNCRPEWLPELTKYIQYINLANNHTYDMGGPAFAETQKRLNEAGVQFVGDYDPGQTDNICEVMTFKVHISEGATKRDAQLPLAVCAWHYFTRSPRAGEMEVMERYAKHMPVIALMHVGVEYRDSAAQDQIDIAHRLIDLGAEFVIGNSPHWVQNAEVYKDKLIVYSTGNFIFDQLEQETNQGLNMEVVVTATVDATLKAWLDLGARCKTWRDDCLKYAEAQQLAKPKLGFSFTPVASSGGYRQLTRKADAATQQRVEARLQWDRIKPLLAPKAQ